MEQYKVPLPVMTTDTVSLVFVRPDVVQKALTVLPDGM